MSLLPFCQWLAETPGSVALRESLYMYPLVESAHVLTLCVFLGTAVMFDLRLLGITLTKVPTSQLKRRLGPWITGGFIVMMTTGVLLFHANPVRSYQSLWFRMKVVALVLAGLNAFVFHRTIDQRIDEWDQDPVPPTAARIAGARSLVLWAIVVVAGRMIAYNWFDCDKQPQPGIVNTLAGCVVLPEGAR
jgi:predicted DNA repair protein MutK